MPEITREVPESIRKKRIMQGNEAAAEAMFAAGCRFFAGYPITPASEVMYTIEARFRELGEGVFFQGEDEIASISAVIGASWGGLKAATSTSGPGFSLMLENLGYAVMTETPLVLLYVMRAGPSTGQATRPGQGDLFQVRYGTQGDYSIVALVPWSVQELFDLTVRAFNISERLRVPVIVLTEESIAHLKENVRVPERLVLYEREREGERPPFYQGEDGVGPMPAFGQGSRLLVTGSTHDEWGWRKTQDPKTQERLVKHLIGKVESARGWLTDVDTREVQDAEGIVLAVGVAARAAWAAVRRLRAKGVRVGLVRPRTLWPFPRLGELLDLGRVKWFLVPEMNRGLLRQEVERQFRGPVYGLNRLDARPIAPGQIEKEMKRIMGT